MEVLPNVTKETILYTVYVNTDLTEGRGRQYALYHCMHEATATRLAKGRDVQGSNGTVRKTSGYVINGSLYVCGGLIEDPSAGDIIEEKRLARLREEADNKARVLAKAKELGLSEEDIAILTK